MEKKEVVWQDLATAAGQAWLEQALASHDVLIENFKRSDLTKFNLEPEDLAARHPHLVRVRLVGFDDAPERLAYDVVVQAETGFMGMNGFEDRPPVRMPVALMDVLASHQIRMAALEGLLARAGGKKADSLPKYRWKAVELPPLSIKPRTNWSTAIRPDEMADNTPTLPPTATSWHARTAMWSLRWATIVNSRGCAVY